MTSQDPHPIDDFQHDERPAWRGLDELAEAPEFLEYLHREFPSEASELTDPFSRREFVRLMSASLGLAGIGLSGCLRSPDEKIVPYAHPPGEMIPGKAYYFATCTQLSGFGSGILVESHLGRPTKIEGNPDHPASLGATDAFSQASILDLYDPDRSKAVLKNGRMASWSDFLSELSRRVQEAASYDGAGITILTETVTSPTLLDQLKSLQSRFHQLKWRQYEPFGRNNVRAGSLLAFEQVVETIYHFESADVILSLDADFLSGMPGSLRYARDFADRRRIAGNRSQSTMNRLYAIESTPTLTGAQADHRLPLQARAIEEAARTIASRLGVTISEISNRNVEGISSNWLDGLIEDLRSHHERCLVVAGDGQPGSVHALAHAINRQLGNIGKTVEYLSPVAGEPVDQLDSLSQLVDEINQDRIHTLIVVGGNPVYNAPGALAFHDAYVRVPFRVHLSLTFDETSSVSQWHIPRTHDLEAWGDVRAFDGTCAIKQPLIAPLYGGKTEYELLSAIDGHAEKTTYQLVREHWEKEFEKEEFESRWRRAIHDGIIAETRSAAVNPPWKWDQKRDARDLHKPHANDLELTLTPDPSVWDGRFSNNGWLQELPKPLTKLTWDNAALVSSSTAKQLNVQNQDLVQLSVDGRSITAAILVIPGQPDGSLNLTLGYGRTHAGRVGTNVGFNANPLRTGRREWFVSGLNLKKTGSRYPLAITQHHHSMEGRNLAPAITLAEFESGAEFTTPERRTPKNQSTLYPPAESAETAWGMTVDQNTCIGCNACVLACQSENNIPIVGKTQVSIGREMQWIRIDRYYRGEVDNPDTLFQPVMCVHCENAPCELVCPVAATVHSKEGLNQMVYNRCVGTRYCSNNCPYKVRRFNFLEYNNEMGYDGQQAPSLTLMRNPDVTVRSRGVMEKCTYCIQRINKAKIEAQVQNRAMHDGEIVTACQQACPTQAIVFGNLSDRESRVATLAASPLNHSLLGELNTRPRTTHLARVTNPNPAIEAHTRHDTPPGVSQQQGSRGEK